MARFVLLLVLLGVVGCDVPPVPVLPPDDAGRPPNPGCVALDPPPSSTGVALAPVFPTSLGGVRGLMEVSLPRAGRSGFAITQDGQVLAFEADDATRARVVLDVGPMLYRGVGESGLVSFALDPGFSTNGLVYLVMTVPPAGVGRYVARIARFRWSGAAFDPASMSVVLDVPQADITHSVDHVAFGSDGMLYVSLGDQRRTATEAQDASTLPGSILRLDVRSLPYTTPDNPFTSTGGAPEVYAIGFRNPWRFTVDPTDGTILVGDVGQDSREEISLLERGGNYGWPDREGTICFFRTPCEDARYTDPLVDMTHAEIRSVVAGYRYRRDDVPSLEGRILYADFVSGSVWSFDERTRASRIEVEGRFMVTSFALDEEGRHHVVRYDPSGDDGGVYRVVADDESTSGFPRLLSETGCVDPEEPTRFREGLVTFAPTAELWSDGAEKSRALSIPDGTAIGVGADGDLELPVGSVLVKHFGYEGRLHETRLLMRTGTGWSGYSYRWNDAGTDAELLESRASEDLPSGVRWQYPSRSDCFTCHTSAAGVTLGLETAQLDDDELLSLLDGGYLDRRITSLAMLRATSRPLVDPFGTAGVDERARSYLHANCSNCHRPGGPGRGSIDLRFSAPFGATGLCNAEPAEGRLWDLPVWTEQRLLVPGRSDWSIVYLRPSLRGVFRMPPLGTDEIDEDGVAVLASWIDGMAACE